MKLYFEDFVRALRCAECGVMPDYREPIPVKDMADFRIKIHPCDCILRIPKLKAKPVKERTNEEHDELTKHYGGIREYLLSMGEFKDVPVQEDSDD